MEWDNPDRVSVEKKINSIEQWCIDNKKGYVTKLTTWHKSKFGDLAHTQNQGKTYYFRSRKTPNITQVTSKINAYREPDWELVKTSDPS